MGLFKRLGMAYRALCHGHIPLKTELKEWKGTDVEFGAYLAAQNAGKACKSDDTKPFMYLYTNADGKVVGGTTRWPSGNRNYVVIQR